MHILHSTRPRRLGGIATALALLVSVAPAAAAAQATQATRATHAAAATKVRCGKTVRKDFTLKRDLRNCRGDGLVVGAHKITIDLNGHLVDGRGKRKSAGVRVAGFRGVVVKNGVIRQFGRGIWLVRAVNNKIRGNTVRSSFDEGIFVNETSSALVLRNTVIRSGIGAGATWADGIDARGNDVQIRGNVVRRSGDDGIDANGDDSKVKNNTVARSGQDGIDVDGHRTVIANNKATSSGDDGIGVGADALRVLVKDNTVNYNYDLGIQPKKGTAIDGGGNTAKGNGDPRQCVIVTCS